MKFEIVRENLLEEVQLLQGIVEKRNTMPILANILINAEGEEVELIGTDLEVGMKTRFGADIKYSGAITVNGKKIYEIVRALPEGQTVYLEKKEETLEIRSGESEFKILCLPKEDYPQVADPKFDRHIVLPLGDFKDMIDRVYYAITQEQRYYLNGALFSLKNRSIELVSTDGHRLAFVGKGVDDLKMEKDTSVIVAKKALSELRKFSQETMEFDFDDNNLFFKVGPRIIISRIIESKFPNYEAVIPKENPITLSLSREELANAIRRVALLSAERSKGIKFSIEKNGIRMFSSNPEIGEARDRLGLDYQGKSLEIGFNAQYLLDFLLSITTEFVTFEIKDENSAVLLRPEGEEGINNIYVLMPMKI
jgi:DNA polymerase-3 subunit beta